MTSKVLSAVVLDVGGVDLAVADVDRLDLAVDDVGAEHGVGRVGACRQRDEQREGGHHVRVGETGAKLAEHASPPRVRGGVIPASAFVPVRGPEVGGRPRLSVQPTLRRPHPRSNPTDAVLLRHRPPSIPLEGGLSVRKRCRAELRLRVELAPRPGRPDDEQIAVKLGRLARRGGVNHFEIAADACWSCGAAAWRGCWRRTVSHRVGGEQVPECLIVPRANVCERSHEAAAGPGAGVDSVSSRGRGPRDVEACRCGVEIEAAPGREETGRVLAARAAMNREREVGPDHVSGTADKIAGWPRGKRLVWAAERLPGLSLSSAQTA